MATKKMSMATAVAMYSSGNRSKRRNTFGIFDYYLSPTGSDVTGNGSVTNPWKTLMLVPQHSSVGLLPGVYDDLEYPTTPMRNTELYSSLASLHGMFKSVVDPLTTAVVNGSDNAVNGVGTNVTTHRLYLDTFYTLGTTDALCMYIAPAGDIGSVTIKMIATQDRRDNPILDGDKTIMENINFVYDSTSLVNYESSISRNGVGLMFTNCNFECISGYSLTYVSECIYENCIFVGGTKLTNYSGTATIVNTTFN